MNNKKQTLRKMIAFVSAISVLSVTNYGALSVIAVETTSQPSENQEILPADSETNTGITTTTATAITSTAVTTTTTTALSSSDTITTALSSSDTTTVTTTTTQPAIESSFEIGIDDDNISDSLARELVNKLQSAISGSEELKNKISKCRAVKTANDQKRKVQVSYYKYPDENDNLENNIKEIILNLKFSFEYDKAYYKCHVDNTNNGLAIFYDVYYPFTGNCDALNKINITAESGNAITENNKTYIKQGTVIDESSFTMNDGYYLEKGSGNIQINSELFINNEKIYIKEGSQNNEKVLFNIRKNQISLIFKITDVKEARCWGGNVESHILKQNETLVVDWLEIGNISIGINCNNDDVISIGENLIDSNNSNYYHYTISEIISQLNTTPQDVLKNGKLEIPIASIPPEFSAVTNFSGETVSTKIFYNIQNNNIQIPVFVKRNGKDYYLSGYSYQNINEPDKFSVNDIMDKLSKGDFYNTDINYWYNGQKTDNLIVYYSEFEQSSNIIRSEMLKNFTGKRNENVYSIKDSIIMNLDFSGNELLNESLFLVSNNLHQTSIANLTQGQLPLKSPGLDIIYYKLDALFDIGEDNIPKTIYFGEPVMIYIDRTAPVVSEPVYAEDYKNHNGWSNNTSSDGAGKYRFSFSVSDNEKSENNKISAEELEQINNNVNIGSVSSIDVGGLVFNKPEGGWDSKTEILPEDSETDSNFDYSIILKPINDENGFFNGDFEAVLTLKNPETDGYNNDIFITAKDCCDNISEKQKINIKIDTCLPRAEEIKIENLVDGLDSCKVLKSHEKLNINTVITDESKNSNVQSGIVKTEYKYSEKYSFPNENESAVSNAVTFDVSNDNISSELTVTLTDEAGNTAVYYYSADEEGFVSARKSDSTIIITDNIEPEKPEFIGNNAEFYENNGQKWYNDYQNIFFRSKDNGDVKSEIQTLIIDINGNKAEIDIQKELSEFGFSSKEITEKLNDGSMYITFVPSESNNQNFTPYIRCEGEVLSIPIYNAGSQTLSLENGCLKVSIKAKDYSGNESSDNRLEFYVDNNIPVAEGIFHAEASNMTRFGTFANKQIEVSVPVSDTENGMPSSGYKSAELIFSNQKYTAYKIENNTAYFIIPKDELPQNYNTADKFGIIIEDNVGNITKRTDGLIPENVISLVSDAYKNGTVILENIKPVVSEIPEVSGENAYTNENNETWYSGDITISYSVSDPDSGIADVNFERKDDADNSGNIFKENYSGLETKTTDKKYTMSTDPQNDGKFDFSLYVADNAENAEYRNITVFKDISRPYISGFNFGEISDLTEGNPNITEAIAEKFGHFYEDDTLLTVTARDDAGASSGIQSIYCVLYNTDGSVYKEYTEDSPYFDGQIYTAQFIIPEGFKGDIKAWATDNVKNRSEDRSPEGFVSENMERHNSTSYPEINMPLTDYFDADGLPLYNSNVTAGIIVTDSFSGIRSIEWSTSDFEGWKKVSTDSDGNIYGDSEGWNSNENERNIVTKLSKDITVTSDSNDVFIRLKITDNSGNITEREERFSIDKNAPVITVSGIAPSSEKKYYNSDQSAEIVIAERNFANPVINGITDNSFAEDSNSRRNTDEFRHTKKIEFNKDGIYHLDIENTDLAGNEAESFKSGEFVIDKTVPKLSVEFFKQNGEKIDSPDGKYINDFVKASISVDELNFDSESITITINGKSYKPTSWQENRNIHTATIPVEQFNKDGTYTISISGHDLAGNSFKNYSASVIIDTVSPEIQISGFNKANKGSVIPVVNISDKNLLDDGIKLFHNGKECSMNYDTASDTYKFLVDKDKYITGKWSTVNLDSGISRKFAFDNFPDKEEFDGAYKLEVSASDKASNKQLQSAEFSVNRFGSVFTVQDGDKLNNSYLNKAQDITITEINVDPHDLSKNLTVIIDKGSSVVKLDENMYSISEPEALNDGSGYKYVYTIFADNFDKDVAYEITICSVDEAGNENVSSVRGAELKFIVDTHEPEFICDDLQDSAEFRNSEKSFKINVNEQLKHIKVTTNLGETLLDTDFPEENSYTFSLPASNTSRSLTIELKDLAGNLTSHTYNNLLVTENIALFMFHKAWVKITGLALIAGIGGASGFLISRKKKKTP